VGEVVELCGARLALGQSTLGREVAPRRLRSLALPDGLATAEYVVKSPVTRPEIQPRSQQKENRNNPGRDL